MCIRDSECDAATIAYANEQGFLIESDGDDVIPDAIRNHTLGQQYGRIETSLDFPDIVPTDNSPAARTAAANKMLRQAVHEMYRYHGQRRTINVTCIAKKAIRAGDLIALTHIDNGHFGLRSYQYNTPGNYLFVTAASVTSENDVLQYELTLSTLLWGYWAHQETDASVMANLIATVSSMRTAGNVDPSGNGIVSGPGTIVEPPAFILSLIHISTPSCRCRCTLSSSPGSDHYDHHRHHRTAGDTRPTGHCRRRAAGRQAAPQRRSGPGPGRQRHPPAAQESATHGTKRHAEKCHP